MNLIDLLYDLMAKDSQNLNSVHNKRVADLQNSE